MFKFKVMVKGLIKKFSKDKSKPLDKKLSKELKTVFRIMFDGVGEHYDSEFSCSLLSLGITNVEFKKYNHYIDMIITLERPGMLIGKGGRTIDRVMDHLSNVAETKVKISIIESKLWTS